MRTLLICIILFLANDLNGQSFSRSKTGSLIDEKVSIILRDNQSDKVLVYQWGCFGCRSSEKCKCIDEVVTSYVIWNVNSKLKVLRIDCCNNYESFFLKSDRIWKQLIENEVKIFDSDFKGNSLRTHYFFDNMRLVSDERVLIMNTYDYYFEHGVKYFKGDKGNSYRKQNLRQPAKHFVDKLKNELKTLSKKE